MSISMTKRSGSTSGAADRRRRIGWVFVAPMLIGSLVFTILPLFLSLYNSFFFWDGIGDRTFIGLDHFRFMFTEDRVVLDSFRATGIYLLFHVPAVVAGGLMAAVALNHPKLRGRRIARTLMLTPLVTAGVAIAAIWLTLFNPNVGVINAGLEALGFEPVNWLGRTGPAMFVLLIVSVWRGIGYAFIFFLGGLASIPEDLQEAARADGATDGQVFRKITLPLLTPTLFLVLILVFVGAAQEFDLPLVLTEGGPRNATTLINLAIYNNAFAYGSMGYASAISTVTFLGLVIVVTFQFFLQKHWVFNMGDE